MSNEPQRLMATAPDGIGDVTEWLDDVLPRFGAERVGPWKPLAIDDPSYPQDGLMPGPDQTVYVCMAIKQPCQ